MVYGYNPSRNLFYNPEYYDSYVSNGSWPDDILFVDERVFMEFSGKAPAGKTRGNNDSGNPCWVDIPPPTQEEQVATAEAEKQDRIDQANAHMNSKQWPGKAAMGRLSDAEKAKYNEWLDYLDALEAVDTSSAPDIDWPTPPAV